MKKISFIFLIIILCGCATTKSDKQEAVNDSSIATLSFVKNDNNTSDYNCRNFLLNKVDSSVNTIELVVIEKKEGKRYENVIIKIPKDRILETNDLKYCEDSDIKFVLGFNDTQKEVDYLNDFRILIQNEVTKQFNNEDLTNMDLNNEYLLGVYMIGNEIINQTTSIDEIEKNINNGLIFVIRLK